MTFKVEDCIFFQLAKASQVGARFWSSCVAKLNLTAVQAMVLNFLGQEDEITAVELGKRTALDSATLTGVLDRLETAGILERTRHPDDRRAINICLTDQGHALASEVYATGITANETFLSILEAKERTMLHALLDKVRHNGAGV